MYFYTDMLLLALCAIAYWAHHQASQRYTITRIVRTQGYAFETLNSLDDIKKNILLVEIKWLCIGVVLSAVIAQQLY